jgi:hypothetical protein
VNAEQRLGKDRQVKMQLQLHTRQIFTTPRILVQLSCQCQLGVLSPSLRKVQTVTTLHIQAQKEEELSPTNLYTYLDLSTPLKTLLEKFITTTIHIKLKKLNTITPNTKLKKFDTPMFHVKLKKFDITNIKLKKFNTPTTPHINQKEFDTTNSHPKLKKPSTTRSVFSNKFLHELFEMTHKWVN